MQKQKEIGFKVFNPGDRDAGNLNTGNLNAGDCNANEEKQAVLEIPNFDADKFYRIFEIDVKSN